MESVSGTKNVSKPCLSARKYAPASASVSCCVALLPAANDTLISPPAVTFAAGVFTVSVGKDVTGSDGFDVGQELATMKGEAREKACEAVRGVCEVGRWEVLVRVWVG